MKNLVIDASVAIKWFIPEIHSDTASLISADTHALIAPDLLYAEFGNILWEKIRLKEISHVLARSILKIFAAMPIQHHSSLSCLPSALEIAHKLNVTIYDSLYLALAEQENCQMITADLKFYNNIARSPLKKNILWIESL